MYRTIDFLEIKTRKHKNATSTFTALSGIVCLGVLMANMSFGNACWAQGQVDIPSVHSAEAYHPGTHEISLNGDWCFADQEEKQAGEWNKLPVPGNWNTFTEYADYIGDAWYQREVTIPSEWTNQKIYLQFSAVYDIADVWWNETYLGQHVGGYTPFEFDVSELASVGKAQIITVKVNNEHVVGAWFQWGGISRDVQLVARNEIRILRQKIEPVLDIETGTAQVFLEVTVENNGANDRKVNLTGDIKELDDVAFRLSGKVAAGSSATLTASIMLNTQQTRVWHFDDPQLYHLKTTFWHAGQAMDQLQNQFGIRKIDIKADGLYLNGEKVRLMGYNRVHDHRAYGNTEPRHLVRADVDMMKRSGANFSRIMHAPCAPELLDYCDERGLLIWAEIPMWQKVYRSPMATQEDAKKAPQRFPGKTIQEMIERDWNHPCIVGWSPGNELRWEANKYVKAMRPFVKELDPSRFYANIHDQGFQKQSQGGYKGVDYHNVDILFMNKYGKDETKIKAVLAQHKSISDLPIFVSEYGETRNESLNQTHDFTSLWETLGKEPYVIGGAHWTFNDYRSYWKLTPPSQNRDWGIVDVWRSPKTFYYQMSKLNAPVRSIDVAILNQEATVTIQPRAKLEIPSFILRGYSWAHELIDKEGKVLEGAIHQLADIPPDSPPVVNIINWTTKNAQTLVISLISKNGYTVAQTRYSLAEKKELPLPDFPEPADPEVRKVLALDQSFMVGVTNLEGDKGLEVRYGTEKGKYPQTLNAPVMGAIRVRGLKNGQKYYGQVRRLKADGFGAWSKEFMVIPDGGLPPTPPFILGLIQGKKNIALRVKPQEKIWGYRVRLNSGETMQLDYVNPGLLLLPGNSASIAVFNESGTSDFIRIDF